MWENLIKEINGNMTSLEYFVFFDESRFRVRGCLNKNNGLFWLSLFQSHLYSKVNVLIRL